MTSLLANFPGLSGLHQSQIDRCDLDTRLYRDLGIWGEAWVDQEECSRLTREAMSDIDAGRVIDHQAMQAWADSLGTDRPLPPPVIP